MSLQQPQQYQQDQGILNTASAPFEYRTSLSTPSTSTSSGTYVAPLPPVFPNPVAALPVGGGVFASDNLDTAMMEVGMPGAVSPFTPYMDADVIFDREMKRVEVEKSVLRQRSISLRQEEDNNDIKILDVKGESHDLRTFLSTQDPAVAVDAAVRLVK